VISSSRQRGGQAGVGEGFGYDSVKVLVLELSGRQVYGDADIAGAFGSPRDAVGAGGLECPLAERYDEVCFLGDGNEFSGRDFTEGAVFPAREGFDAHYFALFDVDEGLIVKGETFARFERLAEFGFEGSLFED